jgi:3-deoxy-D-manno-octulosonic-acid transferase
VPESTSLAYRWIARAATAAMPMAARFSDKLARGHAGRTGALGRLTRWGAARDRNRPLVWLHAASVGEGLQAAAVLEWLRTRHPDWQYLYTHFSPSAEPLARRLPVDMADFLPYDQPAAADSLLEALAPSALVFAKLDLWPELATRAAARGIPVGLVAGTVSPVSGRTRWPARWLQRPGYASLAAAGAIAPDDASRLERLGVPPERITVLGDPRFDSVVEVVAGVDPEDPLLAWGRGAPTLVAGSTWPLDEAVVLEAFATVRREHPEARLVLVPHEPTPRHLDRVAATAARLGLPAPVRLSQADATVPFLLVDRVGVLARLYGGGRMAYVGGGFGRAGLHSVLEPAAWGLPVVFGPWWSNSREAGLLLEAGAAVSLPPRSYGAGRLLARTWTNWLADDASRERAGNKALEVVREGTGAAERNARLVERLVLTR